MLKKTTTLRTIYILDMRLQIVDLHAESASMITDIYMDSLHVQVNTWSAIISVSSARGHDDKKSRKIIELSSEIVHNTPSTRLVCFNHNFIWKLNTSGSFKVKYMYADILNGCTTFIRKYIWKIKVPLKS